MAPPTRDCWFRCVTEMLLLCNEAAGRFAKTQTVKRKEEADGIQTKPLGLEYMADRLDTDGGCIHAPLALVCRRIRAPLSADNVRHALLLAPAPASTNTQPLALSL